MWEVNSWCQQNPGVSATQAGSVAGAVCLDWDGVYESVPFTPNTITDPATCTDAGPLWTYSIDTAPIAAVDDYLKVSIDPATNLVWVKGMTGGPSPTADYTMTVTGKLPTGETQTFPLTVSFTTCKATAPTSPGFLN